MAQREPGYEKMRARLKRTLAIILEADRRRANIASVRPAAVEVPFGRGFLQEKDAPRAIHLNVLKVTTDRGHRVQVNGKIDRIDMHEDEEEKISVIDYKSNGRTLHGRGVRGHDAATAGVCDGDARRGAPGSDGGVVSGVGNEAAAREACQRHAEA